MDKAIALGFYASHPVIMDEIYEVDDLETDFEDYAIKEGLPGELTVLVKANADFLTSVFAQAENEQEQLTGAIRETLRAIVEPHSKILSTRTSAWEGKIALSPLSSTTPNRYFELGWYWDTEEDSAKIVTWVWLRGGRQVESILIDAIRKSLGSTNNVQPAKDLERGVWNSGTVRLDVIDVTAAVEPDFRLDLDLLKTEVLKSFAWIDELSLGDLFKRAPQFR